MAGEAGNVDHAVDGFGSAGSRLGTATVETLRSEALKHLLGVTEHANAIGSGTLTTFASHFGFSRKVGVWNPWGNKYA
jgi:hypothetical protein